MTDEQQERPKTEWIYQLDQQVSVNCFIDVEIDGETFKIQLTTRHNAKADKIYADFCEYVTALQEIRLSYPKPTLPVAAPPKQDVAAEFLAQDGNKQAAAEVQAQAEAVPPSKKGVPYLTFDAVMVEVLPQPDEKVTVAFYGNDRKQPYNEYAGIKINKWKIESANGLMKYVTSEPMSKPAKYTLSCRVYYTEGKEYRTTDGSISHYKDVEHVRPL